MSIEIVPAGSTAVVSDREKSHHPDRWDLASQAERNFDQLVEDIKESAVAGALASSVSTSSVKDSVVHSTEESRKEYDKLQKQVSDFYSDSLIDSAKNASAIQVQSQAETDQLSNQATSNFNLAAVQSTTQFNALNVQSNLMQYNVLLDAQKNAAANVLLMTQIAAAQAAKAAECCCELKSAITFDGQKTRDLINSITEQNLRDRATKAELMLASYFSAKVPPNQP